MPAMSHDRPNAGEISSPTTATGIHDSYQRYSGWTGSKALIFELVPQSSTVLDIGCSSGVIGKELHQKKNCKLFGIEIDPQAVEIARKSYYEVYAGDIQEPFELPTKHLGSFDSVIFGDVLEHTINPEKVLTFYLRYLKEGGTAIISLPNVANWLNRVQLLFGKWEYRDVGTLDKTHLRFYNYNSAEKLLRHSGLKIERVECTSGAHRIDLKVRYNNPAKLWKNLLAYQFVFKCSK